ncbi:MAG: thiamine-phosphate kinase [Flavobacteriales bacterium]|nr:thiamine-phosphate kinase [Flavobacteriales bacterium]
MLENKESRTELESFGEFALIKHLTKGFENKNKSTGYGIGDDAAVLNSNGKQVLVSTDLLVENVHFNLMYSPLKHLGYKSIIVNLSDILAMNGTPEQVTVSIAVSSRFSVEALEELYEGIEAACKAYNVDLVGGDTTSSQSGLMISVTAIGYADSDKIAYRNNAQENDLLFISGDLGGAYIGLQLLEREKQVFEAAPTVQPDLDGHDYALERQLKPECRADVIRMLAEVGVVPTSMIDISDGLASEVLHICESSNIGCAIYENKIPIDPTIVSTCLDFNIAPTVAALNGGEDYELLFTIKQADYAKLENNALVCAIGHITDKASGVVLNSESGVVTPITAQGWDGLASKE